MPKGNTRRANEWKFAKVKCLVSVSRQESTGRSKCAIIVRLDAEKFGKPKKKDEVSTNIWTPSAKRAEFPRKRRWSLHCQWPFTCRRIRELHSRYVCASHIRVFGPSAVIIVAIMHIQISNQHHWEASGKGRSPKRDLLESYRERTERTPRVVLPGSSKRKTVDWKRKRWINEIKIFTAERKFGKFRKRHVSNAERSLRNYRL